MLDNITYYNIRRTFHNQKFIDNTRSVKRAPQPVLATSDGYRVLSPVSGKQFSATIDAAAYPESREGMNRFFDRNVLTQTFFQRIAQPLKQTTTAEWLARFRKLDSSAGPANRSSTHLADFEVIHEELYLQSPTPIGAVRKVRYPGRSDGSLLKLSRPPAAPGQSNGELFLG
ncbi:CoA transferase [Burkholderia sp. 8Y]|uniref:CoA transferase n=1 Tax=Burkholderia sp. 8Y TaxID=2653133 RepID=UPI001F2763C3|nr:CoA transferase [Burkholderia sp. 8Y]